MRIRLILCVVALAIVLPTRSSSAYSLLGGETIGLKEMAVHAQVGYPEFSAQLHMPVTRYFEVSPFASLYFAPHYLGSSLAPGAVGNVFGADLKWRIYIHRQFSLALVWEPRVILNYNPVFAGFQFGVPGGAAVSYEFENGLIVSGGMSIPTILVFSDPVAFILPIDFDMGVELPITKYSNLSFQMELGPAIRFLEQGTSSGLNLRVMVGMEYLL